MSYAERHTVPVVTAAGGGATVFSPVITGRIMSIAYVKTDFTDGVDFTITSDMSLQNVWTEANVNAAKTVAPRQATHSTAGVASLYAAAGEPVEDHIYLANERVKFVIVAGGATKSGAFVVIVG